MRYYSAARPGWVDVEPRIAKITSEPPSMTIEFYVSGKFPLFAIELDSRDLVLFTEDGKGERLL
jgi:hypothetical protein